jgi:dethiobiotin synthetase
MLTMKGPSFFVTGTSTGVGKTQFSCLLLAALRASGLSATGYKPVCCGDRDDVRRLMEGGQKTGISADEVNPLWFKASAAPLAAARIENRKFCLQDLRQAYEKLQCQFDCVVTEGIGGWEVPLTTTETVADLAALIAAPVIVVVDNRLGALNHTILTVNAIQHRGLECAGLVLNQCEDERDSASISNRVIIEEILSVPVLAEILYDQSELEADFINQIL